MRTPIKFRKSLLAAAIGGALAAGASMGAHATAYSFNTLEINDLTLGGVPGFGTFFTFNAQTNAQLTDLTDAPIGVPPAFSLTSGMNPDSAADSSSLPFSLDGMINIGTTACAPPGGGGMMGTINPCQAYVSLGGMAGLPGAPAEDTFTAIGFTGGAEALPSYSRSDHHLTDNLINLAGGALAGSGGDWQGVTEAAVIGNLKGNATSGNQQVWNFAVTITEATTAVITFLIDAAIRTAVTADETTPPSSSDGNLQISFNFTGDASGGKTPGAAVGTQVSLQNTALVAGEDSTVDDETDLILGAGCVQGAAVGTFSTVTCSLSVGTGAFRFQLASSQVSNVDTLAVPEPATLGLMGAGLLALGGAVRRRRQRAQ